MSRIGFSLSGGLTPSEFVDCVRFAEDLGYESAWLAEGHGGDQFAVLAACARATNRILLGTSISSVYVRSAPTIAMAAATVDELSNRRFILGLGSSHKVQVEPEHGIPYGQPLARVRDTVEVARRLLRDAEVSYRGETVQIERFDLWFTPARREIPIYLAALFPKMLELCGEVADGLILTRSTLETAGRVSEHLAAGARRAGRDPGAIDVTSLMPCVVAPERRDALDRMRPGLALYAGYFPRYNRMLAESGFAAETAAIKAAWDRGDREGAVRAVSDAMIDATAIVGTPGECRARLDAYRDSGIGLPIISPFARDGAGQEAVMETLRACAP